MIARFALACAATLALTAPALAQDPVAEAYAALDACLAGVLTEAVEAPDCAGSAAEVCMEATEGGWTTVGIGACLSDEVAWWEGRLAAILDELGALNAAVDREMSEVNPHLIRLAPALDAFHAAWRAYRDAACDYEYAHWMGGTGGGPASTSCALDLTAAHTLELAARLREARLP